MRTAKSKTVCGVAAACLVLGTVIAAYGGGGSLPPVVAQAVKKAFPNATVRGFGRETENGVSYYEVNLLQGGRRIEVEVDEYGGIGEVEMRISLAEAPTELAKAVAVATKAGGRARIEKHERRGVARGGRFVALNEPRVFYEIKLYVNGKRRRAVWRPGKGVDLPKAAARAIKRAFPKAVITGVEEEREGGMKLYEVALVQGGRRVEVEVSTCGVIMEVAGETTVKGLPRAVLNAIGKVAKGASVKRVERTEVRALVKGGRPVKLGRPKLIYEAQLRSGDRKAEVEVAADGTILKTPKWKKAGADDDDDDDDDDDE